MAVQNKQATKRKIESFHTKKTFQINSVILHLPVDIAQINCLCSQIK